VDEAQSAASHCNQCWVTWEQGFESLMNLLGDVGSGL